MRKSGYILLTYNRYRAHRSHHVLEICAASKIIAYALSRLTNDKKQPLM